MGVQKIDEDRKKLLRKIFNERQVAKVWRDTVKQQIRNFPIKDLYDHYDFNYNIDLRAKRIKDDILSGEYIPSEPLIYRSEKKLGICRHIVHPAPVDALVFQTLMSIIRDKILKNQPSSNSFFSRDKFQDFPESLGYGFNWVEQWKKMQSEIYRFSQVSQFLVITDLNNFYDSINLHELRNVISSLAKVDEVVLDLVFKIIQGISWNPDYLPYSARGLPTINIEGIRLLAHSFLFEVDKIIKRESENNFVRWMDDITIGVSSREKGLILIGQISEKLNSRGLSLNISKTNIISKEEAYLHFQIENNKRINVISKQIKDKSRFRSAKKELHKLWKVHSKQENIMYWDKVAKRIINTYSFARDRSLLNQTEELYLTYPTLRESLLRYLSSLGFDDRTSKIVLNLFNGVHIFDDLTLFQLISIVTEWKIPTSGEKARKFLSDIRTQLKRRYRLRKEPYDFFCFLWFRAKYDPPDKLLSFIKNNEYIWGQYSFLRRQVTAVLSRVYISNPAEVESRISKEIIRGDPNSVSVASQINSFASLQIEEKKLMFYLFPKRDSKKKTYELSRFLVLCSVLSSPTIRKNTFIQSKIKETINDPYFRKWLKDQYNI